MDADGTLRATERTFAERRLFLEDFETPHPSHQFENAPEAAQEGPGAYRSPLEA